MTLFSNPLPLPWERDLGGTLTFIDPHGAAAQIADGIALVGWGESVFINVAEWYYSGILHLAAVQHTNEGPVLGPVLLLTPPFSGVNRLDAIISDPDGGAWVFMATKVQTKTPSATTTDYKIGRFTVDPTTLELSATWLVTHSRTGQYGRPWLVDIWPEQRVFMASVIGGPTTGGMAANSLYLISMDTGAIVAHRALPLGSGTNPTSPEILSFHPEREEVLVVGDRVTGGFDRPTLWTSPITATTIGAFVLRTAVTTMRVSTSTPPEPANDDLNIERGHALPRPDGEWELIMGTYVGLESIARHFLFTPGVAIEELDIAGGIWVYNSQFAHNGAIAYDATLDRVVIALSEETDRTETDSGTGLGGVRHLEFDPISHLPLQDSFLPDSAKGVDWSGTTMALAPVGAGRFVYLLGSAGLNPPYTYGNRRVSYGFAVWVAGPIISEPVVPGIKGEAPEENRCAFRELKH